MKKIGVINLVFLFAIILLSLNFVFSQVTYSDCSIYGNCQPVATTTTSSVNYSLVNVNNSQYFQGYTPTALGNWLQSTFNWITNSVSTLTNYYSKTDINNFNTSYLSTTNTSYVPYTGANQNVNLGNNNFSVNGTTLFVNTNTGNVGIGTLNQLQKLHVNGSILANGTINATSDIGTNGNLKVDKNVNITGNLSVKRPYGMFSSTQSQNITSANTPFAITFNWTEDIYQINKQDSNTNFSFQVTGDYLIELSAIVTTISNNKHIEIWVQKNGINIPRSNTRVEIENAGTDQIIAVPFILDALTTDKFRFMMASDSLGTVLVYTTNTSYSPESPSVIITMTKISEITY